ncbi:transcription factor WhiB [Mycolicibacterium mageritense]|nr:transcription factor WhiB [Mycolicibacterium mageritense]
MNVAYVSNLRRASGPPCVGDPERWFHSGPDPALQDLCRHCPRRWKCAQEVADQPSAQQGMVAGVYLPPEGRGRETALRKLRALAEYGNTLPAAG